MLWLYTSDLLLSRLAYTKGVMMKGYMRKVGKTLLFGLVILAIAGIIYLVVPKYQIQSVRVDDDTVVVTKLNTFTGKVTTEIGYGSTFKYDKYGRLQFTKK